MAAVAKRLLRRAAAPAVPVIPTFLQFNGVGTRLGDNGFVRHRDVVSRLQLTWRWRRSAGDVALGRVPPLTLPFD